MCSSDLVSHQRTLNLERADTIARRLDHVVDTTFEPVVTIFIAPSHIASVIDAVVPSLAGLPYEAEYQAAKAKHDELMGRIAENKKKLDYSKEHADPKRGQYLQEARTLAGEQREDAKVWQPIVQKWQTWESQHTAPTDTFSLPGSDEGGSFGRFKPSARPKVQIPGKEEVTVEETGRMKELREQMEVLADMVHPIAPDL